MILQFKATGTGQVGSHIIHYNRWGHADLCNVLGLLFK